MSSVLRHTAGQCIRRNFNAEIKEKTVADNRKRRWENIHKRK